MAIGSKAASKAAATTKSAAKALAGYPGIFRHLAGEHAEVSMIMKRIAGGSLDAADREELFEEMRRNLLAHAHGEEETFYPQLRSFPELEPLVVRCLEEHSKVEALLGQLAHTEKSTQSWQDLFEQMMHAVEAHVEREENELFPRAKDLLGRDQAKEMLDRYEGVEEREKAHL